MSGSLTEPLQADLERWLTAQGFSRGNPFASAEADQERALLPEFFVDVEGYERVKGDRTVVVFAPRGGGKSALRIVLASQAAPYVPDAPMLAVEHTDFNPLIAKWRSGQPQTLDDHVYWLLRASAKALVDTLCGPPAGPWSTVCSTQERQRNGARTMPVSPPTRSRLAQLVRASHPTLLAPEALYDRLHVLEPSFVPDWSTFVEAARQRRLHTLIRAGALHQNETAQLLADINDYPDMPSDRDASPIDQIRSVVQIAQSVGLILVQFLVDRLDENDETADNPNLQADILEPLLAHLPLMELAGACFKFFLAREVHQLLLERPAIRRDRLTDQAVTVTWDRDRLKHLLDERLAVYSGGSVKDFVQLCQGIGDMGDRIEAEMLQIAQGSPRRLLITGQLLCQVHVGRCGPSGTVEQDDWKLAKAELMRKMPLPLRLRRDSRLARAGDREITLTELQHKILVALADGQGYSDREALAEAAWGAKGVSNETILQALVRLREKLGDDPNEPIYLKTERGHGIRLANYDIE